jgi:hypothetical protein
LAHFVLIAALMKLQRRSFRVGLVLAISSAPGVIAACSGESAPINADDSASSGLGRVRCRNGSVDNACPARDAEAPDAPAPVEAGVDSGQPVLTDDAQILSAAFPDQIACGGSASATLTVKNTGSSTWTRAGEYKLGAVGDKDAFDPDLRVYLKDGDSVAPGSTYDFSVPMRAPASGGVITTSWRMVHELVAWFGGTASHDVNVACSGSGETAFENAKIYNSPPDTASWPVTTQITQLDIRPDGVSIAFSKKDGPGRWPDVTPPGWDGPIQYTLWLALNINGQWYASGIVQFWYGLDASGGDVTRDNQIAKNWEYDARWGPSAGHQPAPGEAVGFLVTAGNARGVFDASQSVRERSNMVIVPFPAASPATFTF